MGNPTTYKNEDLQWSYGRNLRRYGNNTFQYGADNIRYKKNNTVYTLDGSTILKETDGTKTITYYYGNGGVMGFCYKDADGTETDYFYEKNLQGDVIALCDSRGSRLVEYVYDAWGKILLMKDRDGNDISNNTSHIGYINPIRYRSYYYDVETDLYYLESRYYDPELGRFLNADSLSYLGDGSDLQNYNLYSYCENNPVMYADPSGHSATLAVALGAVAVLGLGLTIAGAATENNGLTAAGLTMVATSALISGGLSVFGTTGLFSTMVGGATMVAGAGTGLFASAEYQQAFTGNNWILDSGMSEGWYNGLMIGTAAIAMVGTFISSFAYSFNINSIQRLGSIEGSQYKGIRFTQKVSRGGRKVKMTKTLEWHTHSHKGYNPHWQVNNYSCHNGIWHRGSAENRWTWWLMQIE